MKFTGFQSINFSLSLLNHESNIFALPWVLYLAYQKRSGSENKYTPILVILVSLLPVLLFRSYVAENSEVEYSLKYYISVSNVLANLKSCGLYSPLAVFSAFKLFWLFPLIALINMYRKKGYRDFIFLCLIISSSCAQLLFATDTSRLIGLAFPAILVGAEYCRNLWGSDAFSKRLWAIIIFNFFIPYAYIARNTIRIYLPWHVNFYFN